MSKAEECVRRCIKPSVTACMSGATALPMLLKSDQHIMCQESDFRTSITRVNSEFFFTRDLQHATLLLIVLRTQPSLLSVKYPFKFMRKSFKNLCTFYFNYIPWFIKYRWFMIYQRNRFFFSLSYLNSVDSILLP